MCGHRITAIIPGFQPDDGGSIPPTRLSNDMDLKQLSQRAEEIRAKYADLERKTAGHERTTLNRMEGFIVDVGDLMRLVMAKEGLREIDDVDTKLAHELSDCLYSILVLAKAYDVDLQASFEKTMGELEVKIAAQSR